MNIPVKTLAVLFITVGQSNGIETTINMSVPIGTKMFIDDEVILDVWSEFDGEDDTMNLYIETPVTQYMFDHNADIDFNRITVYRQFDVTELVADSRATVYNTELCDNPIEQFTVPALELQPGMVVYGMITTHEYKGSPNIPKYSSAALTIKRVEKLPTINCINVWYEGPFNSTPDTIHDSWFVRVR